MMEDLGAQLKAICVKRTAAQKAFVMGETLSLGGVMYEKIERIFIMGNRGRSVLAALCFHLWHSMHRRVTHFMEISHTSKTLQGNRPSVKIISTFWEYFRPLKLCSGWQRFESILQLTWHSNPGFDD
ncbi:MAG: hypothetical protein LBE99_01410 [Puniceicoccales bacterium]|jgi:hypothetical protein|nr:hypothetical protein [Puniceicoccales bacterium]